MIVLDATVAVKLVTRERGADVALARVANEQSRLAPDWMRIEVASTLSKKVLHGLLDRSGAVSALPVLDVFVSDWTSSLDLLNEALDLSFRLRHAVYDCMYLALAVRHSCVVVTHDRELANSAREAGMGEQVELLA